MHLVDRQSMTIFKAFKSIFQYYLQCGFQITGVTGDCEFASLQADMVELPGAPRLNLASANEHEPFVEEKISGNSQGGHREDTNFSPSRQVKL